MSYFNVFFQGQSAIPGFRLQNYGLKNNPTVTIVTVGY